MADDVSDGTIRFAATRRVVVEPEVNPAAQLLDARELAGHRAGLLALVKDVLINSSDSVQRARAKHALLSWGVDPEVLEEPARSVPPF
jgi:hypothetical protein